MKLFSEVVLQRVADVTDLLLLLQIGILLLVLRAVSKLHGSIITSSFSAPESLDTSRSQPRPHELIDSVAAGEEHMGRRRDMPSVETLLPEPMGIKQPTILEWKPLSPDEIAVLAEIKYWLPDDFAALPADLLVTFVRGFIYRKDWPCASVAYLDRALRWRAQVGADHPVPMLLRGGSSADAAPPKRALFEELCQAGPIGTDNHGHPVIMERNCLVAPTELLGAFDEELMLQHMLYNRECARAYCAAESMRLGKRIYKIVVVMDMTGLSFAHKDGDLISRLRRLNGAFSEAYPESMWRVYVVNAPGLFSFIYNFLLKPFLHPITAAKLVVCGADYMQALDRDGVSLFSGRSLPAERPSWVAAMERIRRTCPVGTLVGGFMPEQDAASLRKAGLRP